MRLQGHQGGQPLHTAGEHHRDIAVYDTNELFGQKGRFRVLQFSGDAVQGAVDLDDPARIVLEYPRAIVHLMELNRPAFETAFMIGLGVGTIARHFAGKRMIVAELDGRVVDLCRTHFGLDFDFDDAADRVIVGDGRAVLAEQRAHSFDYVIVDAFTEQGTPRRLLSAAFFALAREKLHPRGMVVLNLIGRGHRDPLIGAAFATLRGAFAHAGAWALAADGASGRSGVHNVLLAGSDRPIDFRPRQMAGFQPFVPAQGHVIADRDDEA
ncbi:spermidine synthase [Paenibacillus cymbidii]|uniref:spermidine synthase n=1 Tax=Paenibacillus cymbidii TaxID=1639034 RepID=UPI001081AB30|nr:fused MFS/spermidine synthase [Paenibacillus cymbidii]